MDIVDDFAKKHSVLFVTIGTLLGSLLLAGAIALDLSINPWLYKAVAEWHWYNYFTSHHFLAALYLNGHYQILVAFTLVCNLATFLIYVMIEKRHL
jgi:predicted transcriptional regulator